MAEFPRAEHMPTPWLATPLLVSNSSVYTSAPKPVNRKCSQQQSGNLPKCPSTVEQINVGTFIARIPTYGTENGRSTNISNNMNKFHKHYVEQKKPGMEEHTLWC